jgi:hypothetical protein
MTPDTSSANAECATRLLDAAVARLGCPDDALPIPIGKLIVTTRDGQGRVIDVLA